MAPGRTLQSYKWELLRVGKVPREGGNNIINLPPGVGLYIIRSMSPSTRRSGGGGGGGRIIHTTNSRRRKLGGGRVRQGCLEIEQEGLEGGGEHTRRRKTEGVNRKMDKRRNRIGLCQGRRMRLRLAPHILPGGRRRSARLCPDQGAPVVEGGLLKLPSSQLWIAPGRGSPGQLCVSVLLASDVRAIDQLVHYAPRNSGVELHGNPGSGVAGGP